MRRWAAILLAVVAASAQNGLPTTAAAWLEQGQRQFVAKQYDAARESLEQVLKLDQRNVEARLVLADIYQQRWARMREGIERQRLYFHVRNLLSEALELDPDNKKALRGIAQLSFLGRSSAEGQGREGWLSEARRWNLRLLEVDPSDPSGHFALGVLAWTECVGPDGNSRAKAGMASGQDGPIPNEDIRREYAEACRPSVEEGAAQLKEAVALRPKDEIYARYLAQLLRMRADYADTDAAARADLKLAREMDTKAEELKSKGGREAGR